MKTRNVFIVILLMASFSLSACGPLEIGLEETAPPAAPLPTATPPASVPTTTPNTNIPADAVAYTNSDYGFALFLPAGWKVAGPMHATSQGFTFFALGPIVGSEGGPDTSQIIISDQLSLEPFIQSQCGVCPTHPVEDTTLGGQPAKRTRIGGGSAPEAEWYFVTHASRLMGFSIRPLNGEAFDWVYSTLTFTTPGITTYRDTVVGFELDYPTGWVADTTGISNGVILWSIKPEGPGSDGVPADVVKLDVMMRPDVTLTLDDLVAQQKAEVANVNGSILAEERLTLASGLEAVRLHVSALGEVISLLTIINGHPVYVTGFGDLSRFDAVARTLRPVESEPTGPTGFACSVAYSDGARVYCLGEGGTPIPIADAGGQGTLSRPLISGDGSLVAYLLDKVDSSSELWVVVVSTLTGNDGLTLPRRLLAGANQISSHQPEVIDSVLNYQWQAEAHIVYFNTRFAPVGGPTGPAEYNHNDLWKVNADTGEVVNLLSRDSVGQFYLSPDGEYVGISNPQSLAVMRADGSDFKLVLEFPAISTYSEYTYKPVLVWSPDSAFFSVLVPSADPLAAEAFANLYRVSVNGEIQNLLTLSGNYLFSVQVGAGLSPNGQHLAYTPTARDNIIHLRVLNIADANETPLADDPTLNPLGWSPDSNYFAYATASNGNYAATLLGGPQLFGVGLQAMSLKWVDGNSFYFLGLNGAGEWGLYFQRLGEGTQTVATGLNFNAAFDAR